VRGSSPCDAIISHGSRLDDTRNENLVQGDQVRPCETTGDMSSHITSYTSFSEKHEGAGELDGICLGSLLVIVLQTSGLPSWLLETSLSDRQWWRFDSRLKELNLSLGSPEMLVALV
jgi:hypothetical protein